MKAMGNLEIKNDDRDAYTIAQLAHSGFLPKAYISPTNIRELRSLIRFRGYLVNQRRGIKNQVQTLIDRNIWLCQRPKSFKDVFCKRGRVWLNEVKVPDRERYILNECLKNFDNLSGQILSLDKYLISQEYEMEGLQWLRTVPGFGRSIVNAYCVLAETGEVNRFNKAKGFIHYAGLIPREFSSGDKYRTGRIIKNANMHLRTAIIESTFAALRVDKGLKAYYLQKKKITGSGPAIVACARKLANAIYHVLKEKRKYRYEQVNSPTAACHSCSVSK